MNRFALLSAFLLILGAVAVPSAHAITMLQPVGISKVDGGHSAPLTPVIDQSGLSIGYTSGVTDLASYLAANPEHLSVPGVSGFFSNFRDPLGTYDLDLGGLFDVSRFVLWNDNDNNAVVGFNLFADDNAGFVSPTLIGAFTADPTLSISPDLMLPDLFSFAPVEASHIRFEITSNNGSGFFHAFGEIAFGREEAVVDVPVPGSLALLGIGGLALLRRRRVC